MFFALAMGSYPNRGVIDAAFSVVHDGVQRSVFASGRAPHDRSVTQVGPITRRHRRADAHDEADDRRPRARPPGRAHVRRPDGRLRGAAPDPLHRRAPAVRRHPGHAVRRRGRARSRTGDDTLALDGLTVWGCKDRSWGVRPVGAPAPMAPLRQLPQLCFLWAPLNFPDDVFHYIVFEDADGVPWSEGGGRAARSSARTTPTVGPDTRFEHVHDVHLGIDWEPGLRRSRRADHRLPPRRRRRAGAHRPRAAADVPHERRRLHPPDVGPRPLARRARRRPARR